MIDRHSGKTLLLLLFLLACRGIARGQAADSARQAAEDSVPLNFVQQLQQAGQREAVKSIATVNANKISREQRFLLNEIRKTALEAKLYLQKGIDTLSIAARLQSARQDMNTAMEGILYHPGPIQTLRDLKVSSIILSELLQRMEHERELLDNYTNRLIKFREHIDSLTGHNELTSFSSDSVTLVKYLRRLVITARDVNPVDSTLKQSIANVQELQTTVDFMEYELGANLEQVQNLRKTTSAEAFSRDWPHDTGLSAAISFSDILALSWKKDVLALRYYLQYQAALLLILVGLVLLSWRFLWVLKTRLAVPAAANTATHLVVRFPAMSAIIIVTSIFQFLLPSPPFLINLVLWCIPAILLSFIFYQYISSYWLKFWAVMIGLFLLASADNLVLQASTTERWIIFGLALTGFLYGMAQLWSKRKAELREKKIIYFIVFLVIVEGMSLLLNLGGWYNLSKTLLTCGYFGVITAILFLWTVRLINEGLAIAMHIYQRPDKQLFFINFNRVGGSVPPFFYVALVVGWFVLLARNFYLYSKLSDPLLSFVNEQRTIGDYTFSIKGMLLFFSILLCSMLLSRLISFFATENHAPQSANSGTRLSLGSWLLLIRIAVISTGLFIAVAAAGIPLDRITIILGALGVGIGLGLQGLVSNLVSGLILAFEKPVNVGDLIQINGELGTMKAIGFRSSTIMLINGAVNVIPNSDILNNHLVNWSIGQNQARTSLTVGVAYGSDLEQVHTLLVKVLEAQAGILKAPAPLVVAKAFNDSAIDFEMFFWVRHLKETLPVKSQLLIAVNAAFQEAGIVIPFTQMDVHISSGEMGKNE